MIKPEDLEPDESVEAELDALEASWDAAIRLAHKLKRWPAEPQTLRMRISKESREVTAQKYRMAGWSVDMSLGRVWISRPT